MRRTIIVLAVLIATALSAGAQSKYKFKYPEPIQSPHEAQEGSQLTERPYGYYNLRVADGTFVLAIPYQYQSAGYFVETGDREALARVKVGGKYGFINPQGGHVIKCIYDDASNFDTRGFAMVKLNGKWGVIDDNNISAVPCVYDSMTEMHDGWYEVSKDDEWGYVSNKGIYASSYSDYERMKNSPFEK